VSDLKTALEALRNAHESLQIQHRPKLRYGVDLSEQLEATHEVITAVRLLQQKLLTPLAVILCRESDSKRKAAAWLQVVTALGITLKDVIEAIPPEMVRE
jgi:hypothetical protein